ncbi:condensation domain-containing protein [Chitinivorax sp. B]|uniref:condensation domain-containing protein n=1 Tax=Chitinivorax sp. B TaxID=2502235 RepID=UPI0010F93FEC|nr:condensation domain-containing protein [Chitinivorax sp. B]
MMNPIQPVTSNGPLAELDMDALLFKRPDSQTAPKPVVSNPPPVEAEFSIRPQPVPAGTAIPLGYAQLCFWFVYMALGETANNLLRLMIEGELDVALLEKALNQQLQRHDALRASIPDWNPVQTIQPWRSFDLPFQDLGALNDVDRSAVIARTSQQMLDAPFKLDAPPLLRGKLFRLSDNSHVLLLCFPHIVADGGAVHLFQQQLMDCYDRLTRGENRLPGRADTMQIGDFVTFERERNRQRGEAGMQFWRECLRDHPYARFPKPMLEEAGPIKHHNRYMAFPDETFAQLHELAKKHKATQQMCLIAALGCVIHQLTGQSRFTLNSVLESREQNGTENLMAPLLRVMPVPLSFQSGLTFEQLLIDVRRHVLEAYEHKDCPWSIPMGILAEQRWQHSPRTYVGAIRAGGWLFAKLFRRAQLYPRYLADYLFMDSFPPEAGWRHRFQKRPPRNELGGVPDPVININILQGVYKREKAPSQGKVRAWQVNDPRQFALTEACQSSWEDDSINLYIVDTGQEKPCIRITCTNLNEHGLDRLLHMTEAVLRHVTQAPQAAINQLDRQSNG